MVGNPFWSSKKQEEFRIRQHRPGTLPTPPEDEDQEPSPAALAASDTIRKGRGVPATGGRMFVTPPSHRGPDGRGQGGLRKSEGTLPGEDSAPSRTQPKHSMGPVPPTHAPQESAKVEPSSLAS